MLEKGCSFLHTIWLVQLLVSTPTQAIEKPQSFSGYACSKQATYISWITDEAGSSGA